MVSVSGTPSVPVASGVIRLMSSWTGSRATWRRPSEVEREALGEALGVDLTLTMPRSADVATLARAVQPLTGAGMDIAAALKVVGL